MIEKLAKYNAWEIQKHSAGSVQVTIIHDRLLARESGPADLLVVVINGAIERIEDKIDAIKTLDDGPGDNPAKPKPATDHKPQCVRG